MAVETERVGVACGLGRSRRAPPKKLMHGAPIRNPNGLSHKVSDRSPSVCHNNLLFWTMSARKLSSAESVAVPVNLGKPSLRRRLEAYYQRVSPEQIENESEWREKFDKIWEKFGGSVEGEQKLAAKLAKKYGSLVHLEIVVPSTKKNEKSNREQDDRSGVNVRNEEYYTMSETQRGSGILSFTHANFDPLAALASTTKEATLISCNPWLAGDCPLLDRVDLCKSLLPKNDHLYQAAVQRPTKPQEKKEATVKPAKALPAFASIAASYQEGPFSILYDAMSRRKRVRVLTRYAVGIRGTLTGHLLAFDKHYNMILKDVDEVYSPVLENHENKSNIEMELERRLRGYTGVARGQAWTCRHRRIGQLLVRGDVVVLVYRPDQEQSCWPVTRKSPTETIYRRQSARRDVPSSERVGTPGSLSLKAHQH